MLGCSGRVVHVFTIHHPPKTYHPPHQNTRTCIKHTAFPLNPLTHTPLFKNISSGGLRNVFEFILYVTTCTRTRGTVLTSARSPHVEVVARNPKPPGEGARKPKVVEGVARRPKIDDF